MEVPSGVERGETRQRGDFSASDEEEAGEDGASADGGGAKLGSSGWETGGEEGAGASGHAGTGEGGEGPEAESVWCATCLSPSPSSSTICSRPSILLAVFRLAAAARALLPVCILPCSSSYCVRLIPPKESCHWIELEGATPASTYTLQRACVLFVLDTSHLLRPGTETELSLMIELSLTIGAASVWQAAVDACIRRGARWLASQPHMGKGQGNPHRRALASRDYERMAAEGPSPNSLCAPVFPLLKPSSDQSEAGISSSRRPGNCSSPEQCHQNMLLL